MPKRKLKCDVKGCKDEVQRFRRWKGELLKLCTKHEAQLGRQHCGKSVDVSQLTRYDWVALEKKDEDW